MQVCTLLQTDNHASTPPLSFLQAGCPSCHPTKSVKALKALNKDRQITSIANYPVTTFAYNEQSSINISVAKLYQQNVKFYEFLTH